MKIGLVGPSYQEKSLPFDAQRSVNLYPVYNRDGRETSALYGTPGLKLFTTLGTGPVRGGYAASNGRTFLISGAKLYEIDAAGVTTERGSLDQSQGIVYMEDNGFQLGVSDGINFYIFTYSDNTFEKVLDSDLPKSGTLTFIDGYFVVSKLNSGQFNLSGLYDGKLWNALDFATAESSPDQLVRVFNGVGLLWLFGVNTTEIWSNTGDSQFAFQRISGAKISAGCIAPASVVEIDDSVYWLGRNSNGSGTVYKTSGFKAVPVSTDPISDQIQKANNQDKITGYTYNQNGHTFYVLTGGGLETTLVFDLTTQKWHERAYLNDFGQYGQHLGSCHIFAFGKHLVGDRRNGNVYEMSLDYYDDAGQEIVRDRIYTHLGIENQRTRLNQLEVEMETGVGLQTGQGDDPKIVLNISKDGARTWSDDFPASIGKVGKYRQRVAWRRLGMAERITFRVRITDPVKVSLIGSYLN